MKPIYQYFGALGTIFILRLLIGLVSVPVEMLHTASFVISVLFVGVPVLGFYRGAAHPWTSKTAALLLLIGVACQVGFFWLSHVHMLPLLGGICDDLAQTGLLLWTFGLGALLALFVRDKNLLLPMAIFLALFDIWLVYAPEGIAHVAVTGHSQIAAELLHGGAFQVPAPMPMHQGGHANPMAYVGPADWLFISMFFVALYRFGMRTRTTFYVLAPVLLIYLLIVLTYPDVVIGPFRLSALPALLPIGSVILIVNWKEFSLTRDEKISTVFILLLGIAIVSWRLIVSNQQVPPIAPSMPPHGPPVQGSAGSPAPTFRV